ncbi:MAG: TIGR03086 family metal-binding protein [Trebonia sp.]
MHTTQDIRPLHRIAVLASVDVVSAVTVDDLTKPTPCAGWDLGDLLAHMTVQHHGFATAARGHGSDEAVWRADAVVDEVAADPAGAYAAAAAEVLEAFAGADALEATFALPEFGPGATFPGAMAIGFHYVDYVVHGWDVARTLGRPVLLPADVLTCAVPLALFVPDGDFRAIDNAPFGPAIPSSEPSDDLDRILAHLGRSPQWKPAVLA